MHSLLISSSCCLCLELYSLNLLFIKSGITLNLSYFKYLSKLLFTLDFTSSFTCFYMLLSISLLISGDRVARNLSSSNGNLGSFASVCSFEFLYIWALILSFSYLSLLLFWFISISLCLMSCIPCFNVASMISYSLKVSFNEGVLVFKDVFKLLIIFLHAKSISTFSISLSASKFACSFEFCKIFNSIS